MTKARRPIAHANGTIISYGDDVLIERHFCSHEHNEPTWFVYRRKPVDDGVHPTHGSETTETHVWIKIGEGSEAEARALAEKSVRS